MATFSSNSVRQLIVANTTSGGAAGQYVSTVATADGEMYVKYINANTQTVAGPRIPVSAIKSVVPVKYAAKTLRSDKIAINTAVVGQTYNIRIVFRNWGSGSAENQYFKYTGTYKCKTGDTTSTIAAALKALADVNFAREPIPLLTFSVSGNELTITEVAQPFVKGKQQGRPLNYYFQFVPITDSTGAENVSWGTVTSLAKGYAGQGTAQLASDQEYFYLGERGDKYRNVGFPYTFDTTYLVDTSKVYDTIDITYTSKEPGAVGAENDQRVLTILAAAGTAGSVAHTIANAIIGDLETATGLTIADLA